MVGILSDCTHFLASTAWLAVYRDPLGQAGAKPKIIRLDQPWKWDIGAQQRADANRRQRVGARPQAERADEPAVARLRGRQLEAAYMQSAVCFELTEQRRRATAEPPLLVVHRLQLSWSVNT